MPSWNIEVGSIGSELDPELVARIRSAVRAVLEAEGAGDAEISVALLPDDAMREIHREYLDDDSPTDVIAFPLEDPGGLLVGDIYIGDERARAQAVELDVDPDEEIVRLAIHATLHVLGWDHPKEGERMDTPMYQRQEALLRKVLIDDGGSREERAP